MTQWRLLRGDVLVGEVCEYGCDQPYFLARFTPGPGWESARALFESWASFTGSDPDGTRTAAVVTSLRDLKLTLAAVDDQRPPLHVFRNCVLSINGSEARLRY